MVVHITHDVLYTAVSVFIQYPGLNFRYYSDVTDCTASDGRTSFSFQGANSYGQLSQGHKEDQLTPGETRATKCIPQVITGGGGHTLVTTGACGGKIL